MKVLVGFAVLVVMGAAFGRMVPVWSAEKTGDKPANNTEIVHEKLKADKKLIVAKYMDLTESEAKNFWPVYAGEE